MVYFSHVQVIARVWSFCRGPGTVHTEGLAIGSDQEMVTCNIEIISLA